MTSAGVEPAPASEGKSRNTKRVRPGLPSGLLPRKDDRTSENDRTLTPPPPSASLADAPGSKELQSSQPHQDKSDKKVTSEPHKTTKQAPPPAPATWRELALCLLLLTAFLAPSFWHTHSRLTHGPVRPKTAVEAGEAGFAEERAMSHVRQLAGEIGFRQEGSPGLQQGKQYLVRTVLALKAKAGARMRVEVDVRDDYSGSFNLVFLQKSMTLAYQNLTNILVRVSPADVDADSLPSVLVNGHYDSSIASQGAADCASCVATMLETLRQIVEGDLVPPAPLIFLFNGGEEIFLKASHGFLSQQQWSGGVGAFVNLEAAGTRLPDLLVQSGAPWVQRVYGESVPFPMASVIAQDVFPHLPGDTDFRILAQDYDDIPGLDIMLTLNGYAYHTGLDTPENLQPGALQVRGENLLPLLWGLARAPELMTRSERRMARWSRPEPGSLNRRNLSDASWQALRNGQVLLEPKGRVSQGEPVFFDVLWTTVVGYSHAQSMALLTLLLGILVAAPLVATLESSGCHSLAARADQLVIGFLCYLFSWVLALLLPVLLALLRVWASQAPMSWYSNPAWAFASYFPVSLAGLLLPHTFRASLLRQDTTAYAQEKVEWSSHWGGVVGCNLLFSLVISCLGSGGGYLQFWWAVFLTPSLFLFRRLQGLLGRDSPWCTLAYLVPSLLLSNYSVGFLQFTSILLVERMGQSGTHPLPMGLFIPDVVVAVVVGAGAALCFAPYASAFSRWVCHRNTLRVLVYASLALSAHMCRVFPYTNATPKRVVLCRSYATEGPHTMLEGLTVVASADANDASFVFKYAPEFKRALLRTSPDLGPHQNLDAWAPSGLPVGVTEASPITLLAQYPINELLDRPAGVQARLWQAQPRGVRFPHLRVLSSQWEASPDEARPWLRRRRVHVQLDSGTLKQVWSAVLNITGPLVSWSLADGKLPAPERSRTGGPASHMLHLGGGDGQIHWSFWLEASSSKHLRIEMAVMDQAIEVDMEGIVATVPGWIALYPVTSYRSTYFV